MKRLTILKKPTDFSQSVGWELVDVLEMSVFGIVSTDSNDLVILLALHYFYRYVQRVSI